MLTAATFTGSFTSALPTPLAPGQSGTAAFDVIDEGPGDVAGTGTVNFFLETSPGPGNGDIPVGSVSATLALASGDSQSESLSYTIPANTPAGTYYMEGVFEKPGTIDTALPFASNAITIVLPVLSGQFTGGIPTSVKPGDTFTPQLLISDAANAGDVVNGSEVTGYYFSTTPDLSGQTVLLQNNAYTLNVAAGATATESMQMTVPQKATSGTYYLVAKIDANQAIPEGDTSGNIVASTAITLVAPLTQPTITWHDPADIDDGSALGAAQLDATANVAGTFAYTPAAGTILPAGDAQVLSVVFTPTDTATYSTATATAMINVLPNHLEFFKEPANTDSTTDVNAPVRIPFVIRLENFQDKVITSDSTDGVTIILDPIAGSKGSLIGPSTPVFASGEFDNQTSGSGIGVDIPGTYTLSAQEVDDAGAVIDTTPPITSKQFKIAGDHLAFKKEPADTDVNTPIPFVLELEDAKDKVVSTDSTDYIDYTLSAISGGTNALLGGIRSDQLAAGVDDNSNLAPADALTINDPGTYTLSATEYDPTGNPIATTTTVTSKQFKIAGDHLAFKKEPADTDVDTPIPFVLELEDAKDKVVSDSTDYVDYTLSAISGGKNALLGGIISDQLAAGVDDNSNLAPADALMINDPGTYTLSATEYDPTGNAIATTTPVTSKQFKIAGDHLAFKKQPMDTDVNTPIPFVLQLEDAKNKVVSDSTDYVDYTLSAISGGTNALLGGIRSDQLAAGVDDNSNLTPADALTIDVPGTYTLSAVEFDPTGNQIATTTPVTSKPFKIAGDHLAFKKEPADTDVNTPIPFVLELEDAKDKVVSTDSTDYIDYTLSAISGGKNALLGGIRSDQLAAGVDDNSNLAPADALMINDPGTYTLSAVEFDPTGNAIATTTPVTSKQFKIAGDHLAFKKEPADTNVNTPIPFVLELEDAKDKVVSDSTDYIDYTLSAISGGTNALLGGIRSDQLAAGVDDNSNLAPADALTINDPGTYTLSATEFDPTGNQIATTTPVTSRQFVIRP